MSGPYDYTPTEDLPAHVCPTCRRECPVDRMPHGDCEGWGDGTQAMLTTRLR